MRVPLQDKKYLCYALENTINRKLYIGVTSALDERLNLHFSELRRGKHKAYGLQEDYNKYGKKAFAVYRMETNISYSEKGQKELKYILQYKTYLPEYGYNAKDKRVAAAVEPIIPIFDGMPKTA